MLLFGAGTASYLALKHYIWRWIENPVPLVGAGGPLGPPNPRKAPLGNVSADTSEIIFSQNASTGTPEHVFEVALMLGILRPVTDIGTLKTHACVQILKQKLNVHVFGDFRRATQRTCFANRSTAYHTPPIPNIPTPSIPHIPLTLGVNPPWEVFHRCH